MNTNAHRLYSISRIAPRSGVKTISRLTRAFGIVEQILRDRTAHFAALGRQEALSSKITDMLIVILVGTTLFGAAMGLTRGLPWMLASSIKLPLLFFASLGVCLPTLYYFGLLVGGRLTFGQTVAVLLTALTVTAVLDLGFALISLFFRFSGSGYAFMVVLDVLLLAVSAGVGLLFLVQGALYLEQEESPARVGFWDWIRFLFTRLRLSVLLVGWIGLFGIVGTQMAWRLRPFFGTPGTDFVLLVPVEGNFYQGFFAIVEQLLTGG